MRNWKKFMAVMMAATMMVGSTGVAYAAQNTQGTGTATGGMEGTVATDVFVVEVPTDFTYTFKMDPEGLIAGTDGAAYSGATFEEGASVFFPNTVEGGTAYSSLSDAITITNKGTTYAKVSVEASIANNTVTESADGGDVTHTINMVASDEFTGTATDLYLAIVDADENETALTDTTADQDAEVEAIIDAAPEGAYYLNHNGTKYEYVLKDDLTGIEFDTYTFQLKGACNTAADWSKLATAAPALTVTWKVEQYAPTGTAATFAASANVGEITVTDGINDMKIAEIVSVTMTDTNGATYDAFAEGAAWEQATYASGTITLDDVYVNWYGTSCGMETCDATVTYKTVIGQTVTEVVEDVLVAEPATP